MNYKLYFTKNIIPKINDISYYTQIQKNCNRLYTFELLKIKGAYIDSNGFFRCNPDMPSLDIPMTFDTRNNIYKLFDKDDVIKAIYVNSLVPTMCSVFIYSSIYEEIIIAQGLTDINNHLKIFSDGLPLLQYGRNIYVRCIKQPIIKFIQLDNQSKYDIITYRRNKKDGCKLQNNSGANIEIINVNLSNNDLRFIK